MKMPSLELDELVNLLQFSVAVSQRSVTQRHQARLDRLRQLERRGRTEMFQWLETDRDNARSGEPGTVKLPLVILRPKLVPQLSEFSIEFDSAVEGIDEIGTGTRQLRFPLRRRGWFGRQRLHRIKIRLWGVQPGNGEVLVDDKLLKVLSENSRD